MLFWPAISAAERQPGGVLREGSLTALLIGEPGVCMYVWGAERFHPNVCTSLLLIDKQPAVRLI